MAIEYSEFSTEQQEALLRSRIQAWEADHFGHEINKQAFAALADDDEAKAEGMKQANEAQAVLESSIKAAKAQREKIKAAKPATAPATTPAPAPAAPRP